METPTFCDMIHLKELNQHVECYKLGAIKYLLKIDVTDFLSITETRYKLLVRDGYLIALKDFVTLESFSHLFKICKCYISNENNLRATNFPPLGWLKNKYARLR